MKNLIIMPFLFLLGCASAPITTENTESLSYNCSNVEEQITMLENEKKENNKRILNGIRSILPIGVVRGIVGGRYTENFAIATGEWATVLDEKVVEMQQYQAQC